LDETTMTKRLTSAMEDYLKAIFELGDEEVSTQELAEALSISPASVSGMLKKLADLKLVDYEKYRGVKLTPAGRKMALETIRHHRLIETYLTEALGYAWHEVHDEAEKLEHVISEVFEDKIAEVLGHPTYDPHGDPIPRRDGSLPESLGRPLPEHAVGERLAITRVTTRDREALRYLERENLRPGSVVTYRGQESAPRVVTLEQDGRSIVLSYELADKIHGRSLGD
jgi:DtxR family transcriptional regulator, Mn-dependent transcriptional regulator